MTDDQPGVHHEPSQDSSNRPLDGRSSDSSDSDSRPIGKLSEGLGTDRHGSTQSNGPLRSDDAITAEVVSENSEAFARMLQIRQGPLPPAEELARYEQAFPGIAERIVCMSEGSISAANAATLSEAEVNNAIAYSIREDANSHRRAQWIFAALTAALIVGAVLTSVSGTSGTTAFAFLAALSGLGVLLAPRAMTSWSNKDKGSSPQE